MTEYKMPDYEPRGVSPSAGFFILLGLMGAGLVIGGAISMGVFMGMTGTSMLNIKTAMFNPQFANAARMMQMLSQFFLFFVPALATARIMRPAPLQTLGFKEGFNSRQLLLVISLIVLSLPLIGALGELNQAIPLSKSLEATFKKMEDDYAAQVTAIATMHSPGEFIYSLVVMALLPAIFEETFFRGGLQQILVAWFRKPMLAIVVTSILFSALHISFYGFLPRAALGMMLGLIFYYSGSLWLNIILHFINNAFVIGLMYYFSLHGKPVKDAADANAPIWMALPATVMVVLLLRLLQQASQKRNINKIPPMDGPSFESNLA